MTSLEEEMKMICEQKKPYNFALKEGTQFHLILHDVNQVVKKKKYKKTLYLYFECRVLRIGNEVIPNGKHTIQLPSKTAVYQLYGLLKDKNKLKERDIELKITKRNSFNYDFVLM